jgi:hypothetical protein
MDKEPIVEGYSSELLSRVALVREASLSSIERNSEFNNSVVEFNASLRKKLLIDYGDAGLCKKIPEWHRLVGSTVEVHEIDQDIKRFIIDKITSFIESYEEKWNP